MTAELKKSKNADIDAETLKKFENDMKALEKAKEEINEEKNETEKSGSTSPEICKAPEKKEDAAENEPRSLSVF